MKFAIVLLLSMTVCRSQDFATTAGQFFQSILPNFIMNQAKNQQQGPPVTNIFDQRDPVAGGVEKMRYEELIRQVQNQTSDDDILQLSEEMFNSDTNNAYSIIQINLQGTTTPASKNDEAPFK